MVRSTEDMVREAFAFHEANGAELARQNDRAEGASRRAAAGFTEQAVATASLRPAVERQRRHWTRTWLPAAAVVIGVMIVLAVTVWRPTQEPGVAGVPKPPPTAVPTVASTVALTTSVPMVAVPDVAGLGIAEATARLKRVGLTVTSTIAVSEEARKGRVLEQDPPAGRTVEEGEMVTLTIGSGPAMIAIPGQLVGMPLDEAVKELADVGLEVADEPMAGIEPKGEVVVIVRTDTGEVIRPDDTVLPGERVTIRWSDGSQFVMPDLTDLTPDAAAMVLASAGWDGNVQALAITEVTDNDPSQVGLIVGQTPAVGTAVSKAVAIAVKVGRA